MATKSKTIQKQKRLSWSRRTMLIGGAAAIVIASGLVAAGWYMHARFIQRYDATFEQAGMEPIRELIIKAATGLKADAPVEPKTGDVYFSDARLYLPYDAMTRQLVYDYGSYGPNEQPELSISSRQVLNRQASKLYAATTTQALFEKVPELQACSRGLRVTTANYSDSQYELKGTVKPGDGRELRIYLEKQCGDLDDLAEALKKLRPY